MGFDSRQPEMRFEQCDGCGAYRAKRRNPEGGDKWVWAGGCRACDRIRHLSKLLAADVKVTEGPSVDTLRKKLQIADEHVSELETKIADFEAAIIQTAYQLGMDRDKALELIEGHENWKALPRYAEGALTHSRAGDLVRDLQAERESHRKTKVALERAREWMSGEGHNASCRSVQTPNSTDPCSCGYTAAMKDEPEENENAGK